MKEISHPAGTVFASLVGSMESYEVEQIQVNIGRLCNQACSHCHLGASPDRTETMDWTVMEEILHVLEANRISQVEVTGGAPELNPYFRAFISKLRQLELKITVRINLTVLMSKEREDLIPFFLENRVHLAASLPCYLECNVCDQRGEGVYYQSIAALRRLNSAGYGKENNPHLMLVHNPNGFVLPGKQSELEAAYRRELAQHHGIWFSRLFVLTNMPIGRFRDNLEQLGKLDEYYGLLAESFNSNVLENLMCRRQISVDWDGTLYDCDYNLALGLPVNAEIRQIGQFDQDLLAQRTIATGSHCLGCTAGSGSSCQGALDSN